MWRAFPRFNRNECSRTRRILSGYMDRCLNPEDRHVVDEHLRACQGCREELESLRATVTLLRRLPEVTPSRSFAVTPVAPVPSRGLPGPAPCHGWSRPAAGAGVCRGLNGFVPAESLLQWQSGADTLDFGSVGIAEEGESYWVVSGVKNSIDPQSETPVDVELVVPDGSDNVCAAVTLPDRQWGRSVGRESGSYEMPRLAVTESEGEADAGEKRMSTKWCSLRCPTEPLRHQ